MPIKEKENYNAYMRKYYRRQNEKRIMTHGGKCEKCGEKRMEFLSITKKQKPQRRTIVLCWNCRFGKKIKVEESKKESIKN